MTAFYKVDATRWDGWTVAGMTAHMPRIAAQRELDEASASGKFVSPRRYMALMLTITGDKTLAGERTSNYLSALIAADHELSVGDLPD